MTVTEFIAKWKRSDLKERSAAQEHFIDMCRLVGQRLITIGPGSNEIRRIETINDVLAAGDLGDVSARVRIRPLREGTNNVPQRLHHTQTPGIYINGTEASSVATPIAVPAQSTAVEYRITADPAAARTNIYFQLTDTNDYVGVNCTARFYVPKLTKVNFWGPGSANNVDVNYSQTNTLWIGMPAQTNTRRVRMQPYQYPAHTYLSTPYLNWTDWLLVKVTGGGADPASATLNTLDWESAYGVWNNDIATRGIRLDPGSYTFEVGFDMNGNGTLDASEVQETCKVHVLKIDINGDYNRDGNPVDDSGETNAITFTGPKGFVILANTDDDNGDGAPDCEQDGSTAQYRINGSDDVADIHELHVAKLGIASNAIPAGMTVEIKVLNPSTGSTSQDTIIFAKREDGFIGGTTLSFSSAASVGAYFGGSGTAVLGIEGRKFGEEVLVRMQVKIGEDVLGTDEVRVLVAPWLALANDRQITDRYSGFGDESSFTSGMNSLFGAGNIIWVNGKVWRQDEGEFGYTRTAVGQSTYRAQPVILDMTTTSDDYKNLISSTNGWEDTVRSPFHHRRGGFEVSVPDAAYPYGRLILSSHYSGDCDFLETQQQQWPPIFLFVDWLYVAHVDEVMSVIPSGGSSVVCVGDLTNAIAILKDYTTYPTNEVEECVLAYAPYMSRSNLVSTYNDPRNATAIATIQAFLDSAATNLAAQLDVTIIRIPVAYTLELDYTGVTGNCKTYLPNSVNAAVANVGGTVKVGIPDPAFYPFRDRIVDRLSFLGANAGWINSDVPHTFKGEAHCTSNTHKEPPSSP